jgi:hypothetical protein
MIKIVMNFMIKPASSSSLLDSYLPWKTKIPRERGRVEQKSCESIVSLFDGPLNK